MTPADGSRYAAFFHELDAWTEYWDIYHPETHGRFYRGDGSKRGQLDLFVPASAGLPPVFVAWKRRALGQDLADDFSRLAADEPVASAALELDDLVCRVVRAQFGDPAEAAVRADYLRAINGCATDTLPAATERASQVSPGDLRQRTAGRHTIEGDMMWFVWALEVEAATAAAGPDRVARCDLHALALAGVATGTAASFAKRGHRRTRPEYRDDDATRLLLQERGARWAQDVDAAATEVHELFQIREWGQTRRLSP
ncbi:hypothetical protein [Lapillicoccus sp.]|uniref:hypothetical protein n=1 Tax=Lapillicoccus sp. TaxID=1909287 RepID=UPI00326617CE